MMALHMGLRRAAPPAAIVGYSGIFVLPDKVTPDAVAGEVKGKPPVLLIHGADDTSAMVEESRRLERALSDRGRDVELIVVPGAGHVFNFKQPEEATRAWDATLEWLHNHLART